MPTPILCGGKTGKGGGIVVSTASRTQLDELERRIKDLLDFIANMLTRNYQTPVYS